MVSTDAYKSTNDRRAIDASPAESTTGRVAGGAFRSVYRPLSDAEKDLIDRIKLKGEEFFVLLCEAGGQQDTSFDSLISANLMLSFRHMEDAVYRAVKHVTGPK